MSRYIRIALDCTLFTIKYVKPVVGNLWGMAKSKLATNEKLKPYVQSPKMSSFEQTMDSLTQTIMTKMVDIRCTALKQELVFLEKEAVKCKERINECQKGGKAGAPPKKGGGSGVGGCSGGAKMKGASGGGDDFMMCLPWCGTEAISTSARVEFDPDRWNVALDRGEELLLRLYWMRVACPVERWQPPAERWHTPVYAMLDCHPAACPTLVEYVGACEANGMGRSRLF